MTHKGIQIILLLTLLLSLARVSAGQERVDHGEAAKAIGYGFVSPNTRADLQLAGALRNLDSADEERLVRETIQLACRVRARFGISRALGNWADGAENSLVFRVYADEATVRFAAASLGKRWQQKTVLYFRRQQYGKARLYVISAPRRQRSLQTMMLSAAKILDAGGVTYRTLVPLKTRVLVYIVDLSNELLPQVRRAARRLHARPLSFAGSGGFIGEDNDRQRAQGVFAAEIQAYTSSHSLNQRCR